MDRRLLAAALGALLLTPASAGAATVAVEGPVLHVVGTAGSERISFDQLNGGTIYVSNLGRDQALDPGAGCQPLSASRVACAPEGVQRLLVELGGGDDEFLGGRISLPAIVHGGDGDDALYDKPGVDEFYGGDGDDLLWMDSGPDADADVLQGGPGYDRASYGQWRGDRKGLRLSVDDVANDGVAGENDNILTDIEALNGGYADDVLIGSPEDDELDGRSGDDELYGLGGDDLLTGGEDADAISGGEGFDVADYSWSWAPVTVTLDGRPGDGAENEDDDIRADVEGAFGGYGNDTLTGNADENVLAGFEGDDVLTGLGGEDTLFGDEGDDQLDAADGAADEVWCGEGIDRVWRDVADVLRDHCAIVVSGPRVTAQPETPTPTPTPTPTRAPRVTVRPPVPTRPVATPDTTAPTAAVLRVATRARVSTLRRRGLVVSVRCNELCRASAELKGPRGRVVARSTRAGLTFQERRVRLWFGKAAKRGLRAGTYELTVTLTDRAGNATKITRRVRVA